MSKVLFLSVYIVTDLGLVIIKRIGTRYLKLSEPTKDLFNNLAQDNHVLANANRNQHILVMLYEEDRDSADK